MIKTPFKSLLVFSLFAIVRGSGCLDSPDDEPGVIVDFFDFVDEVEETVCLPMRSADIKGVVVDGVVEVTMTQEFETYICPDCTWPSLELTQARYQLPLDERAAVTAFRVEIGDRVIEGIVKDKDEARKEFDEAVEAGKPAFLAEQTRPDIFEIGCGNMPPNAIVRVIIVYVSPLVLLDRETYQFVLPTKVAPRYNPRTGDEPIPDLEPLLNSGVSISIGTLMSTDVTITSDTHGLQVIDITSAVTAVQVIDENPLISDVVIDITVNEVPTDVQVFVEKSADDTYAMMLSWVPPESQDVVTDGSNKEFVFILDRSGSMGNKVNQLRIAMRRILEELHPEALFNIVGFGSSFEYLFSEGSHLVGETAAYDTALAYIDSISANLGGTELLKPIQAVLESEPIPTHERVVFLITDGQVSNEDDIIDFVGNNLGSSRVFTLGLGPDAGRYLLNGVARNGDGTSDYVNGVSDSAITEAVGRQISTALSSSLFDAVEFGFDSPEFVTLAPHRRPPFFSGRRIVQYFLTDILSDGTSPPGDFTLTTLKNGTVMDASTVPFSEFIQTSVVFETDVIHKIAARELIRDLEEGRSSLHDNGAEPSDSVLKDQLVMLGVKYQIASSETSFVAIDNFGWTAVTATAKEVDEGPSTGGGGGSSGAAFCFSGQNTILVRGKGSTLMKDVKIGDMVAIGKRGFSQVYGFGHRDEDREVAYLALHIDAKSQPIEITRDHLVFVAERGAIPASNVVVGDSLLVGHNEMPVKVVAVSTVHRVGAFAPFTYSGTVSVNNVLASSYVTLQERCKGLEVGGVELVSMHWLAHALQAPRRLACSANPMFCNTETYDKEGIATWVSGPFQASRWLLAQNEAALAVLVWPILFVAAIFWGLEALLFDPVFALIVVTGYLILPAVQRFAKKKVA